MMNLPPHPSLSVAMLTLVGKTISAVAFVEGYVQIEFLGSRMSVLTKMHLVHGDRRIASDVLDFASSLSACVGAEVLGIQERGDNLIVRLSSDDTLEINLADLTAGPESFIYQDGTGRVWVA
jgi:hypothetical protein